ncbi:hypothetical protein [Lacicoccus qingdaonensis]|uniref:Uncharacterized protein n=1 Tax=Lacicoccus qingdaonensis TaxID=576118 RepID=A0A1G9EZZ2_9BACL|nr:hypothetical protein [Salinicoccus qingdaonensis]SDK81672.1 hypothetical protein SAMN05216216_11066 [Salinicoccus qingdaonensis]
MKKKFEIAVHGCDDSTCIEYDLTEEQMELVEDIAIKITEASSYACMPVMDIKLIMEEENK